VIARGLGSVEFTPTPANYSMFKKIGRALGGKGGSGLRVRFDVVVVQVERLPNSVKQARVVLSRHSKTSLTDAKPARNGEF
jgi:hypothetical protein